MNVNFENSAKKVLSNSINIISSDINSSSVHTSWELELGRGLVTCVNEIYELLSMMVANDSFPD